MTHANPIAPIPWPARRPLSVLARAFADDTAGATAIEYAVLGSMFATVLIGSSGSLRDALLTTFGAITNAVANAN